ncbi:hypothetical protein SORBI_3001G436850 [Sorghum bicolor]|uniref:Uncharacterized protein n=1 Tax=Sorghum bicolor TaxID=4558 RepID=A0A1Z5SAE0_SORBI|nr:hypothetical protein SORBI_3001G436850 [Sorghum bicolor]
MFPKNQPLKSYDDGSNWFSYSLKWHRHPQCHPKVLRHVHSVPFHIWRKPPLEPVQQGREHQVHHASSRRQPETYQHELEVLPRKPISFPRNLSAMNFSGSAHSSRSRLIAHTFTRTRAPFGTV